MKTDQFSTIYLKDYQKPDFLMEKVELIYDLGSDETKVTATSWLKRTTPNKPLVLDGREIPHLDRVSVDGRVLESSEYQLTDKSLTIPGVPEQFCLEIMTRIKPKENTALEGLYFTNGKYCTQCEAEGFRRMTYFLDRPDVMCRYQTKIIADRKDFPYLLSNGNPIERGELPGGRHFVVWQDPFPKPSYLFALVAGDLAKIEDFFITRSGRRVTLQIFVEAENRNRCAYAMQAVKDAMKWDEDTFGLEYDLDIFMIVAVSDFNMGAMENKGLNIFNAKYILADPESATDDDFLGIQSVVGHEYFHNWTGNRVTCRDWFQLSLKEGLTVYRDQEFSSDMTSRQAVRIKEVDALRNLQFAEDQSPMAHPVRPSSYMEINNFYTATVYNKGAELIRMMATILGREGFRKGMDLYFERHDGQAVTTDDFVAAMMDANDYDLTSFKRWYEQAGTPRVKIDTRYDASKREYCIKLKQEIPDTLGQAGKKPQVIPIKTSLLGSEGRELPFTYNGKTATEHVILLEKGQDKIAINGIDEKPVGSFFREFSAPVIADVGNSPEDELFLMRYDTDPFNQFEATQRVATAEIARLAKGESKTLNVGYCQAIRSIVDSALDPQMKALCLSIPSDTVLLNSVEGISVDALFTARRELIKQLGSGLETQWLKLYQSNHEKGEFSLSMTSIGKRELKNRALHYLASTESKTYLDLCAQQYHKATNMTDSLASLSILASCENSNRAHLLNEFYQKWADTKLVIDKWFALIAGSSHPQVLQHVRELLAHPAFDILNPNRVYAVFRNFCVANPYGFHAANGEGYQLVANYVLKIDPKNPSVAARLVKNLARWYPMDLPRQSLMKKELLRIKAEGGISRDVFEIVEKGLA